MREFITSSDIEAAHLSKKKSIKLSNGAIVTDVGRDMANQLQIELIDEKSSTHPASAITTTGEAPFIPGDIQSTVVTRKSFVPSNDEKPHGYNIDSWRKKFPILKNYIHVANCSQSPQSDYTRQAAEAYLESWNSMGMDWDRWMEEIFLAKEEFARLINASPNEIAIGTSVSELTSSLGSALPLDKRKKVVLTEAEFPTIGHIWLGFQKYGLAVDFIPVSDGVIQIEDYDRLVDENTLITSFCDVYYYNGFKQDIARIIPKIHEKGSLAYLDAYQGIGTHPIDVKALDLDFLSSGNLKYLCGIPGVAFLYVKKELIPYLKPAFTGWFGQENPFSFDVRHLDYASDARRFDNGTPPVMTAYIARAGMQMINEVGIDNIQAWTDRLSERCIQGARERGLEIASPLDIARKAPNTAIRLPGDSHAVEAGLKGMGIIASARADVIRIAPHFFTRLNDIDYVLDCLAKVLQK